MLYGCSKSSESTDSWLCSKLQEQNNLLSFVLILNAAIPNFAVVRVRLIQAAFGMAAFVIVAFGMATCIQIIFHIISAGNVD